MQTGVITLVVCILLGCAQHFSSAAAIEWNLSPEAELSYATLLLDQSIRHDNKEGVLEAVAIFSKKKNMPQPLIDAVAWLVQNKEQDNATAILKKGISLNPDSLELHLLLAEIWLDGQEVERAVALLQDFQQKHKGSELAKQEVGILYVKVGRYQEADRLFSALPDRLVTPFVRYCHAKALVQLGRNHAAIRQLRKAIEESPEFLDATLELSRLLEKQGQIEEASDLCAEVLDREPNNQEVWLRLVEIDLKAGNPEKALQTVKDGPENLGFQLGAITLFLDAQAFTEAEALLQPLKEDPNAPDEVWFYLAALAYESHKDKAETLNCLEKIAPTSRLYDRALRMRVQLLHEDGRTDEALKMVQEGIERTPSDRELLLMQAHLLLAAGQKEEALAATDKALKEHPNDEDLLFFRGSLLDMLERKAEALALMEELIKANPDEYRALNYVGYTLAESNKDLDRALTLLHKAVKLAPDQAYILDSLAWAQFKKGQMKEALKTIRRAVALPGSEEWTIWDHYGDIAAALNKHDEARRAWTKSLSLEPETDQTIRNKLNQQ